MAHECKCERKDEASTVTLSLSEYEAYVDAANALTAVLNLIFIDPIIDESIKVLKRLNESKSR